MADLINLNKARKLRDRKRRALEAAEQRIRHGRSKQQKQVDASVAAELQRKLDGIRRMPSQALDE